MYIEPADRPSIKKGEFVGRVGNSGNSTGPHLHLDRATVDSPTSTGVKVQLRFNRIWAQEWEKDRPATSGRWYRFRGEEFEGYDPAQEPSKPQAGSNAPDLRCATSTYHPDEPRCRYTMFHGSPFGDALSVTATPGALVTAFKQVSGKMRIESYPLSGTGSIGRLKGSEVAGSISEVKLLNPDLAGGNVASVVRDGSGDLRIIGWTLNPNGSALRRDGSSRYVDASNIDAATITKTYDGKSPRDLIVVSSRGPMGMFALSSWDTNLNN